MQPKYKSHFLPHIYKCLLWATQISKGEGKSNSPHDLWHGLDSVPEVPQTLKKPRQTHRANMCSEHRTKSLNQDYTANMKNLYCKNRQASYDIHLSWLLLDCQNSRSRSVIFKYLFWHAYLDKLMTNNIRSPTYESSMWAAGRSFGPVREGIRRSALHESPSYG